VFSEPYGSLHLRAASISSAVELERLVDRFSSGQPIRRIAYRTLIVASCAILVQVLARRFWLFTRRKHFLG